MKILNKSLIREFGARTAWGWPIVGNFTVMFWTATTYWFGGTNICIDSIHGRTKITVLLNACSLLLCSIFLPTRGRNSGFPVPVLIFAKLVWVVPLFFGGNEPVVQSGNYSWTTGLSKRKRNVT